MLKSANGRTGRRPGSPDTKAQILEAARGLLAERGLAQTSVRAVAARARVDPSLVLHFFGSKQGLFDAALQPPVAPAEIERLLAGGLDGMGERLANFYVRFLFRERAATVSGLVRSAVTDEDAAARLRAAIEHGPLAIASSHLGGDDAKIRTALAASWMIGIFLARHILRLEPLAALDDDELVARIAPLAQRVLEGQPDPRRSKEKKR